MWIGTESSAAKLSGENPQPHLIHEKWEDPIELDFIMPFIHCQIPQGWDYPVLWGAHKDNEMKNKMKNSQDQLLFTKSTGTRCQPDPLLLKKGKIVVLNLILKAVNSIQNLWRSLSINPYLRGSRVYITLYCMNSSFCLLALFEMACGLWYLLHCSADDITAIMYPIALKILCLLRQLIP